MSGNSDNIEILDSDDDSKSSQNSDELSEVVENVQEIDEEDNTEEEDSDEEDDENSAFILNTGFDTDAMHDIWSAFLTDEESGDTVGKSVANIAKELSKFNHNFKKYIHLISKPK